MNASEWRPSGLLTGKAAVITGVGQGIGKACAELFVREGALVLGVDFSGAQEDTAAQLGPALVPFHADVSQDAEIAAMFAAALRHFGRVDASLHVAGTQDSRQPEETVEEFERMIAVNLRGTMMCTRHAVNAMLPAGRGSIINFTSVGALNDEARAPISYSAAKAGVHSLTKAYAVQFGPQGIRANVIAPGFNLTENMRNIPADILAEMSSKSALQRPGEMLEQARVAAFLASDWSSYVTGTVIPVDGGWSARMA